MYAGCWQDGEEPMMHSLALVMAGKVLLYQPLKLVHARPTADAAFDKSASVISPIPLSTHCSPRVEHTAAQLWYASPRYHCGAAVAVTDAETPGVKLDVGVLLAVAVTVGVPLLLRVTGGVRVLVTMAVADALAPNVKLLVGVYEACGQKHRGSPP